MCIGFREGPTDGRIQIVDVGSAGDPGGSQDGPATVEPQSEPGFVVDPSADIESVESGKIRNRLPFFFTSPRYARKPVSRSRHSRSVSPPDPTTGIWNTVRTALPMSRNASSWTVLRPVTNSCGVSSQSNSGCEKSSRAACRGSMDRQRRPSKKTNNPRGSWPSCVSSHNQNRVHMEIAFVGEKSHSTGVTAGFGLPPNHPEAKPQISRH